MATREISLTSPKRRLTREDTQRVTRERLLASAYEVFARRGYAEASVEQIAEHAGYSKGAVYSNFESKQALFLELLRQRMEDDIRWSHELLASSEDAQDILRSLGERFQEFEQKLDWCLISAEFQLEANRRPEIATAYAELLRKNRKALAGIVAALFRKANRPLPMPAQELAAMMMGMVQGLAMQRAADPEAVPRGMLTRCLQTQLSALLK